MYSSVLAQKMEQLIRDPELREKFIKNGIKTVEEKFTAEKQFTHFVNMLDTVYSADKIPAISNSSAFRHSDKNTRDLQFS